MHNHLPLPNIAPTVSVKEAAELLKVHPQRVLDLIALCAIPAAKIGRAYVMRTKDVLAFVENQVISQTAERMRASVPGGANRVPLPPVAPPPRRVRGRRRF